MLTIFRSRGFSKWPQLLACCGRRVAISPEARPLQKTPIGSLSASLALKSTHQGKPQVIRYHGPCRAVQSAPPYASWKGSLLPPRPDHVLAADDTARQIAQGLWHGAGTGVLAFTDPATSTPFVSRIGFAALPDGCGLTLISEIALHTAALRAAPAAALLLGEPGERGDPLNSPRLSVRVTATFVSSNAADRADMRALWLSTHPKARLYVDFSDFHFVRLIPTTALLNGGFGRAHTMTPADFT